MRSFNMRLQGVCRLFRSPRFDSIGWNSGFVSWGTSGSLVSVFLFLQVPASGNEYNEMGLRDTGVLCYFS